MHLDSQHQASPYRLKIEHDIKVQKRIKTKYNLVRELVDTEETFNADLTVVSGIYAERLLKASSRDYVSPMDILALFSNIEELTQLSRKMVSHLKECIPAYILSESDLSSSAGLYDIKSNVGEVFLEFIPKLEAAYTVYCSKSRFQLNTYYRLSSQGSPAIDEWLRECSEASKDYTQAWTLDALLIKPVQRLMKYPLLMASMLGATTPNHPDYPALKHGLKKMQETANKINSIEPSLPLTITNSEDYNTAMSRLKDDPHCDEELEMLLIQLDRKQRHIKNLVKYLRENIVHIQTHFDKTSSLAHTWNSWGDAKRYRRFAMFTIPFTSAAATRVSSSKLLAFVEADVLSPLQTLWGLYESVSTQLALHDRVHASYSKYVDWKSNPDEDPLDQEIVREADTFLKVHNLLKIQLPELFSGTEKIIDSCMMRYISIQRDWFRVAVDSTSTVFELNLNDIRGKPDPIITSFHQSQSMHAHETLNDLGICNLTDFDPALLGAIHSAASIPLSSHSSIDSDPVKRRSSLRPNWSHRRQKQQH